jgi:hypothetical protein
MMSILKMLILPVSLTLFALLRWLRRRRGQVRFIRETLAEDQPLTGTPRVIVSVSTLPDRIANLEPTLDCLMNQTRMPDEIVLALPEFSLRQQKRYLVPQYLAAYSSIRILHCEKDWGPATKFIPVVQQELAAGRGETLIMVVDDDRVYPRDGLETYLHYHRQLPDAALCFRGALMPNDLIWLRAKTIRADRIHEPRKVAVITGCGSYFIQPRFFNAQLWDYSAAPAGAFYMDDIWISGWLDRRKIDKYVVPASEMMRTVRRQTGTMTLHDVPNGRRQSNNETIAFFRESWNVFSPRLLERLLLKKPDFASRGDD